MSIGMRIGDTRAAKAALVVFTLFFASACSHKAMSVFFDVPPPEPEPESEVQAAENSAANAAPVMADPVAAAFWQDSTAERPPIEAISDWDKALELLPVDKKGRVDWSEAVRVGTVRPRAIDPQDLAAKAFQMDFVMPAAKEKFDAWFPHSSHTEWLGCKNCHGSVFKYASNEITMKQIRAGESCGTCHDGETAFTAKDCGRCHLAMKK